MCGGMSACVDAHLPTVEEGFRTYRQWRTYSIYRIEADDAITWYDSLSRLERTRCRRARKHLPCTLSQQRFAHHLRSAPKFRTFWLFACAIRAKWFPWVTNRRIRHTLWTVALRYISWFSVAHVLFPMAPSQA